MYILYNARDTEQHIRAVHNPATLTPYAQRINTHTQRIKRTNTEQKKHKTEKHTYKNSQRTSSKQ